jgi:hypothetical protein
VSEPTPLSVEELVDLEAGFGLAAAVMPEYIRAAKRVHVSKSEWLPDWWVGYGKDDGCQIEGTQNHWRWLAHLLLGLVADRDAPYSEDKPLDDPVARLFATIDAQATEIAALKGALEEAEERISLLEDGLRGMKSYTGSAEALQYVRRVLAREGGSG